MYIYRSIIICLKERTLATASTAHRFVAQEIFILSSLSCRQTQLVWYNYYEYWLANREHRSR